MVILNGDVEHLFCDPANLGECFQTLARASHPSQLLDGSRFLLLLLRPVLSGYMLAQCVRASCSGCGVGIVWSAVGSGSRAHIVGISH